MKGRINRAIPLAAALAFGVAGPAGAAGFWDLVATTVVRDKQATYRFDTVLNAAKVMATWDETASKAGTPGQFDGDDLLLGSLDIFDRNGVLVLQSPANIDRAQLDAWAAANAAAIFKILYPAGISELTGATDDNILVKATVSQNLFTKAAPAKKYQNNAEAAKKEAAAANAEHQTLRVNDYHGRANSIVMGFSQAAESGFSYSLTIPYRSAQINDDLLSRSRFLGLEMAAKYPVKKWDRSEWNLGGCLFGSSFTLNTKSVEKSGNLKYGGGAFTSLNRDLGFGTLGLGLDYRLAKAYMPASMNSDDVFFEQTADYVNHHSPVQTLSYGFNLGMPSADDTLAVNLEVIRSNFIGDDIPSGQKGKTSVGLSCAFYPSETFEFNLGINRDYGLDRVDNFGVMLGVINRF